MVNPTLALAGYHMTEQELTALEHGYHTGNPVLVYGDWYTVPELSKSLSIFGPNVINVEATLRTWPPLGVPYPRSK